MLYRKVRVSFNPAKRRFYRVLLVQENMNLVDFGCYLMEALGATFEHLFMYRKQRTRYVIGSWIDFGYEYDMADFTINDLADTFTFIYDTGDYYEFTVKMSAETREINASEKDSTYSEPMILLEGKGQGIWEDNIYSLLAYLQGELSAEDVEDEERGFAFPWNYDIEKFGDFDNPIDIHEIQNCITVHGPQNLKQYQEILEEDLGFQNSNSEEETYEYYEDEDEYDDEDFELDEAMDSMIREPLNMISFGCVAKTDQLVEEREEVRRVFDKLSLMYDVQEVYRFMVPVLLEEYAKALKADTDIDYDAYEERIQELLVEKSFH